MVHRRTHLILATTVILLLALIVKTAPAVTTSQVLRRAAQLQDADCRYGWPGVYKCINPFYIAPHCGPTGQNRPGKPQWLCGGVFIRARVFGSRIQECDTYYWLSPWNRVLYPSRYTCKTYGVQKDSGARPIARRGLDSSKTTR